MTNHSETTGSPDNEGGAGIGSDGGGRPDGAGAAPGGTDGGHCAEPQVTLRTPAELADALPYLLGHRPEDSIVLVALHDTGGYGRFGGRARLGIPADAGDWAAAARQLSQTLVRGSERRGAMPEGMIVYVCQEPAPGETGHQVMERLRPLAQSLRTECGTLDVPVVEALCLSGGRYWSYCCPSEDCCPSEGVPMGLPGTSVLAAAAVYAGLQVRGLRELRARLLPREGEAAVAQEVALDTVGVTLVPRMLGGRSRADVADETLELAERVMARFSDAPSAGDPLSADAVDDELLTDDEAAALILGLQDRTTRDRAAEWMEGDEAGPALRLWRTLARRCVGPYGEHAAAPLTLVGWVAWSSGDELEAREALAMALCADPSYLFARLLHQACNEGLDPESVRRCLRGERARRNSADRPGSLAPRKDRALALGGQTALDKQTALKGQTDSDSEVDVSTETDPGMGTVLGPEAEEETGRRVGADADKACETDAGTDAEPEARSAAELDAVVLAELSDPGRRRRRLGGRTGAGERRTTETSRSRPRTPETGDGRPPAKPRRTRPGTTTKGRFRAWGSGAKGDG